jgi:hypothetical protein
LKNKMEDSPSASQILSACSQRDGSLTQDEEKEIRKYYLSVVNNLDLSFQKMIDKIKEEIMTEYGNQMKYLPLNSPGSISYYPGSNYQIVSLNQNIISIGRIPLNTITAKDQEISRIQCFIFLYQEDLVVLDCWSANGTKCINLETKEKIKSLPNARKIITFPRRCRFILQIPGLKMIFNPGRCLECKLGPRQVKLSCGHFLLCHRCYSYCEQGYRPDLNCEDCDQPLKELLNPEQAEVYIPRLDLSYDYQDDPKDPKEEIRFYNHLFSDNYISALPCSSGEPSNSSDSDQSIPPLEEIDKSREKREREKSKVIDLDPEPKIKRAKTLPQIKSQTLIVTPRSTSSPNFLRPRAVRPPQSLTVRSINPLSTYGAIHPSLLGQ